MRPFLALLLTTAISAGAQDGATVAVLTHEGGAHLGIYFKSLAVTPEVSEVVLSDADGNKEAEARAALGDKLRRVYSSPGELFAAEKPVMALISMEAARAPEAIEAALDAGCHVMAEKPACVRAEDFEPLVEQANAKGLHIMLALAHRVDPVVREARRIIADGELGKVYGIEMHLIEDQTRLTSPSYQASWFADKSRAGGGHLAWLGIHWLDRIMYITDSPIEAVTGFAGNVGGQPITIEDSVAMAMRFANGSFGTLTSGYYRKHGSTQHLKIWGSKGWIEIDTGDTQSMRFVDNSGDSPQITELTRPGDINVYIDFVREAVRASLGLDPPPITADASLRVLKTVFRLYDAAEVCTTLKVESG